YCMHSLLHAGGFHECNIRCCSGPFKKVESLLYQDTDRNALQSETDLKRTLRSKWFKSLSLEIQNEFRALFKLSRRKHLRMILGVSPSSSKPSLQLGSAEILVFGKGGKIYAAPNMIYHYVTVHHYKPPDEFLQALKDGPCPPEPEYLKRLEAVG